MKSIKVSFDNEIFRLQTRGGISRYFSELIGEFQLNPELGITPIGLPQRSSNMHLIEKGLAKPQLTLLEKSFLTSNFLRGYRRLCRSLNRFRESKGDLRHFTFYSETNRRSNKPTVVTVYDMIPEVMPGLFRNGNPHFNKERLVRQAALVICISQATRRDLLACYPGQLPPIVVIPLGTAKCEIGIVPIQEREPTILFVGSREGYKDFAVLVEALALVNTELKLVCVGGGAFSTHELKLLQSSSLLDRVMQLDVTDARLAELYSLSSLFIFPSRYEGFGLPTLEAMAHGCPVLLANSSSHPEVGGEAAMYFESRNPTNLAERIVQIMESHDLRVELQLLGLKRASLFTWGETARLTAEAYRKCLDEAKNAA